MPGGIGAPELLIVLVILLVLFGGSKLPKLAKSLGEAKREFETTVDDDKPRSTPAVEAPPLSKEEELRLREDAVRRREEELKRSGGDSA